MSLYDSFGYQGTEDTWRRIYKPELSLEKEIMSGYSYWDICPKVFDNAYSMCCLSFSKAHLSLI